MHNLVRSLPPQPGYPLAGNYTSAPSSGGGFSGGIGLPSIAGAATSALNFGLDIASSAIKHRQDWKAWKRVADYNSPKAQMQRLAEAGLNPNLMYGQITTGNMSNTPQYDNPHLRSGFADALLKYKDAQIKTAQSQQIRANANKTNAEAFATRMRTRVLMDDNRRKNQLHPYNLVLEQKRAAQIDANIERLGRLNGLTSSQIDNLKELISWNRFRNANQSVFGNRWSLENDRLGAMIDLLYNQGDITQAQFDKFWSQGLNPAWAPYAPQQNQLNMIGLILSMVFGLTPFGKIGKLGKAVVSGSRAAKVTRAAGDIVNYNRRGASITALERSARKFRNQNKL